jgi:hypothetical protein
VSFLKTPVASNIKFVGYYTWWVTPDNLPHITLIDLMLKLLSQQIFTTVARTTCLAIINLARNTQASEQISDPE